MELKLQHWQHAKKIKMVQDQYAQPITAAAMPKRRLTMLLEVSPQVLMQSVVFSTLVLVQKETKSAPHQLVKLLRELLMAKRRPIPLNVLSELQASFQLLLQLLLLPS